MPRVAANLFDSECSTVNECANCHGLTTDANGVVVGLEGLDCSDQSVFKRNYRCANLHSWVVVNCLPTLSTSTSTSTSTTTTAATSTSTSASTASASHASKPQINMDDDATHFDDMACHRDCPTSRPDHEPLVHLPTQLQLLQTSNVVWRPLAVWTTINTTHGTASATLLLLIYGNWCHFVPGVGWTRSKH